MIKQKTAETIWSCYREIEAGKKLLHDLAEAVRENPGREHEPHIKDAFGHPRSLQLGIPMGENAHRLFGLSPKLALSVIRAHMADKRRDLAVANELARFELDLDEDSVSQGDNPPDFNPSVPTDEGPLN